MNRILLSSALLLAVAVAGCKPSDNGPITSASPSTPSRLDPRLGYFLEYAIQDRETLEAQKRGFAADHTTFEQFIYSVYSGALKMDDTPDNAHALAKLGGYLENRRPPLAPALTTQMEAFHAADSTHSFMRGMFLETVRGLGTKR